jgi:hypothetical protein
MPSMRSHHNLGSDGSSGTYNKAAGPDEPLPLDFEFGGV